MRVAIVGSRKFLMMRMVRDFVEELDEDTVVVSGGADGVDRTAASHARVCDLRVDLYPADWKKHGKAAGFIRNHDIVNNADRVVAFWDGRSRGTAHTIGLARKKGLPLTIHELKLTVTEEGGS